jgi:hypothetical protein
MRHIGSPGGEKQLHDIIQEIIYKSCRSMFQKATLGPPLTEAAACRGVATFCHSIGLGLKLPMLRYADKDSHQHFIPQLSS